MLKYRRINIKGVRAKTKKNYLKIKILNEWLTGGPHLSPWLFKVFNVPSTYKKNFICVAPWEGVDR